MDLANKLKVGDPTIVYKSQGTRYLDLSVVRQHTEKLIITGTDIFVVSQNQLPAIIRNKTDYFFFHAGYCEGNNYFGMFTQNLDKSKLLRELTRDQAKAFIMEKMNLFAKTGLTFKTPHPIRWENLVEANIADSAEMLKIRNCIMYKGRVPKSRVPKGQVPESASLDFTDDERVRDDNDSEEDDSEEDDSDEDDSSSSSSSSDSVGGHGGGGGGSKPSTNTTRAAKKAVKKAAEAKAAKKIAAQTTNLRRDVTGVNVERSKRKAKRKATSNPVKYAQETARSYLTKANRVVDYLTNTKMRELNRAIDRTRPSTEDASETEAISIELNVKDTRTYKTHLKFIETSLSGIKSTTKKALEELKPRETRFTQVKVNIDLVYRRIHKLLVDIQDNAQRLQDIIEANESVGENTLKHAIEGVISTITKLQTALYEIYPAAKRLRKEQPPSFPSRVPGTAHPPSQSKVRPRPKEAKNNSKRTK